MYRKIVIPLDGTEMAETAIPHALTMAMSCDYPEIILIRVVQPTAMVVGDYALKPVDLDRVNRANIDEARQYLESVRERIDWGGLAVTIRVLEGSPAETIAEFATELEDDVVVLATHGRAGVKRLLKGSVAEAIVQEACVPVMMVRGPGCAPHL